MKIISACSKQLEELACSFDQYRLFYKQSSDIEAAKLFLKERFQKNDSTIFLELIPKGKIKQ